MYKELPLDKQTNISNDGDNICIENYIDDSY